MSLLPFQVMAVHEGDDVLPDDDLHLVPVPHVGRNETGLAVVHERPGRASDDFLGLLERIEPRGLGSAF